MSFAVFQQLTESTVIDSCLVCSFTSREATNLILCKGDRLEVYDIQRRQGKLIFAFSSPLFGRPEALGAFHTTSGAAAHIAVVLRRAQYLAVLRYQPQWGNVHTCGQHMLVSPDDAAASGISGAPQAAGLKAQVVVDPEQRCLAVRGGLDRVLVFAISHEANWQSEAGPAARQQGGLAFHQDQEHPPGLRAPWHFTAYAPLRLHHIEDIKFLPGYRQPTMACLGQVRPGWAGRLSESNIANCSLSIVSLDLEGRTAQLVWTTKSLPHDVFRIVPLHPPVGGVLALTKNVLIYLKEHGPSFCQLLNPCASLAATELKALSPDKTMDDSKLGILLTGCSVTVLSPTTLLFSVHPVGRLYLAHLVLNSQDTVSEIVWTSPATVTPAWDICSVGEEFVFVAAASGGGTLLKLTVSKKKLPGDKLASKKRRRIADDTTEEKSEDLKALLALHDKLRESARSIRSYTFAPADELTSFGAIQSMAPWVRESDGGQDEGDEEEEAPSGTERFICCSGTGAKGAMYIFQRAVPLENLTEFDLRVGMQYSAIWTFRQPPEEPLLSAAGKRGLEEEAEAAEEEQVAAASATVACARHHRIALVSGTSRSMALETTEEIEEIEKSIPFDLDSPTICAGGLICDRLAVQVTPQKMCFMRTHTPRKIEDVPSPFVFAQDAAQAGKEACAGSVCDPYIAVVFKDQSLRVFRIRARGEVVEELTSRLPAKVGNAAVKVSIHRTASPDGKSICFLSTVSTVSRGTLCVLELPSFEEVFRATHLADVPPVLRNACTCFGEEYDRFRALTDPCAPLPRRVGQEAAVAATAQGVDTAVKQGDGVSGATSSGTTNSVNKHPAPSIICAEFVEVDEMDRGPTLIVLVLGRPVLIYRAFLPAMPPTATPASVSVGPPATVAEDGDGKAIQSKPPRFPWHFALHEHDLLGIVEHAPSSAYRPVAQFRHAGAGATAGVAVVPPHAGVPALLLAARRNRLFVHPLPGSQVRGFSPLHAACCERGFFILSQGRGVGTVVAQICAPAVVEGLPDVHFDLHTAVPCVKQLIARTPQHLATRPSDQVVALAVSDSVEEAPDQQAGPSVEEDPLGDDWSVVRVAPVEAEPPPMTRFMQRYELWLGSTKDLAKLGQFKFNFDADEHVLCMEWMTLPGFPQPSLVVGTGVNMGEDLTCRGRLLIFSTKGREPGVIPPVYQRSLKTPVTVVGQWQNYLVHSEGFKLFFEKWESNNFNKLAFFDGSMCVTAISSIKNFLLLGDLRNGLDFVQWKEDATTQNRNLRRLSRSPPSVTMTVLACDFVVCGKSLGIVALDHLGTAHLFQYSPHSDGREGDQLLRSCATFSMGSPCRAALRLQAEPGVQCLFAASGGGELLCLRPIDDQVYRTVTTMLGMLSTRLPFRCGLNPRALRTREGAPALVAPRKNIEDANMLRLFAFLSSPIQGSVADKMRLSVESLMRTALPCATSQLAIMRYSPGT